MVLKLIRNLSPPCRTHDEERVPLMTALFSLSWIQFAQLFSGWLALTCDSIDMFNVILSTNLLKAQFHVDENIVMLMVMTLNSTFRIFGGALFGIFSDRFGRKWPLVVILSLSSLLQIGTGFTQTIRLFFILRSLSGLTMGGVWGIAVSNALENLPVETRGLASGILAQGYPIGYLLANVMSTYLISDSGHTWRVLFWIGSGMIAFAAIVRAALPESQAFLHANAREEAQRRRTGQDSKSTIHEVRLLLKAHWHFWFLCAGTLAWLNAALHGSQDLYPTYLVDSKGFTVRDAIIVAMVGSGGAIVGGLIAGSLSQFTGRRLTMILFLLLGAPFIPLWMVPSSPTKLRAGAFLVQFGVQGASGVVPIWLAELSPPGFLAFFLGVIVQIGNILGSGSGEIETLLAGAKHFQKTIIDNGKSTVIPGLETVMCVVTPLTIFFAIASLVIAPENRGSHFEARDATFEEGDFNSLTPPRQHKSLDKEKHPHLTTKHPNLEIEEKVWSG